MFPRRMLLGHLIGPQQQRRRTPRDDDVDLEADQLSDQRLVVGDRRREPMLDYDIVPTR